MGWGATTHLYTFEQLSVGLSSRLFNTKYDSQQEAGRHVGSPQDHSQQHPSHRPCKSKATLEPIPFNTLMSSAAFGSCDDDDDPKDGWLPFGNLIPRQPKPNLRYSR